MTDSNAWIYSLWSNVSDIPASGREGKPEWVSHIPGAELARQIPNGGRVCQGVIVHQKEKHTIAFEDVDTKKKCQWADFGDSEIICIDTKVDDMITSVITPAASPETPDFTAPLSRGDVCTVHTEWGGHPKVFNCLIVAIRSVSNRHRKSSAMIVTNVHFKGFDTDWSPGEGSWVVRVPTRFLFKSVPVHASRSVNAAPESCEGQISDTEKSDPPNSTLKDCEGKSLDSESNVHPDRADNTRTTNTVKFNVNQGDRRGSKRCRDFDVPHLMEEMARSKAFIKRVIVDTRYLMNSGISEMNRLYRLIERLENRIGTEEGPAA